MYFFPDFSASYCIFVQSTSIFVYSGDDGSGLGASHQTGWTGLAAYLCQLKNVDTGVASPAIKTLNTSPATTIREK
jgi:hypothetical protein